MPAAVEGVAFDLEGTIVDVEALHHAAHLRAAADVGVVLTRGEAMLQLPHFIGGPDEEVAAEIVCLASRNISMEGVLSTKRSYFAELLRKRRRITARRGFRDFARWLKTRGLAIAVGTVTDRTAAFNFLERSGLLAEFGDEMVVAREDVSSPKPAPDVYRETARRLGIGPDRQLVFEDSAIGLKAGRSAGCRVAAVPTVRSAPFMRSLYSAGAEVVFTSWRDRGIRSFVNTLIRC